MFKLKRNPKRVIIQEYYWNPRRPRKWTGLIMLGSLLAALGLMAFTQAVLAQNTATGAGELSLNYKGRPQLALQHEASLYVDIQGLSAAVTLEQHFENTSDHWVDGRYVFPLPDEAAVYFMQIQIGERIITSTIKEREEAKKIFKAAQDAGKKAALTEQHRPNIFSQSIANIGPKEQIKITLKYSQPVAFKDGEFSVRFPMTMTPRFMPGTLNNEDHTTLSTWSAPTTRVPDANAMSPWYIDSNNKASHSIAITIALNAGLPLAHIASPYHTLKIQKNRHTHLITPTTPRVTMDRDFVLTWQTTASTTPSAATFAETIDDERYIKLMILPPAVQTKSQALPREVLFILDTSGSMGGPSIAQAKQSLRLALQRLKPHDYFNIYEFNSDYSQLFTRSLPASPSNISSAHRFVQHLKANGGTNMAEPLQAALQSPLSENPVRQLVFITDGSVGNEAQLFKIIDQHLGKTRLFTVGIGSAPNSYFMRKAAEFGRGTFTHIGRIGEVKTKMATLFTKLESPVLSDITITWPKNTHVETWPQKIPDVYSGEPLVIYAKLDNSNIQHVFIEGLSTEQHWQQNISISASDNTHSGVIAQGWARAKIDALLDEKIKGRAEELVREDVLAVALKHHLMSPYTSLIAVEETLSNPDPAQNHAVAVPLIKPRGQTLAYPQTASTAGLHLLWSCLALLGLAGLHVWRRYAR